ncbi:MAG: alpha-glucosidase C-terminal domain-containing protein [Paludibacteraceae bacterium]|nr:alpha-glucosidase C-terminal domain-containing protein [Paludibacteraceae bacterium]
MKKLLLTLALLSATLVWAQEASHPQWAYDATIYELNTRQLTPEGTFRAAEAVLPTLKENGIDIIWVMPCQPIGKITRKGTLGSYYSIIDYCQINPEFGTLDDFKHFLQKAHELGFKVILDWVANHTAPDSKWTENPGWHYRDSLGNLMVQYDWTDISKLDYHNQDMRQAMLQAMRWWMDEVGIDGFRCDVAGEVPTDFWNWAMSDLRRNHPDMFTLAEDEDKAQELTETAFDMYYGWTLHHIMNEVAQGKKTVADLWAYFRKAEQLRPRAIRMNFITNHDENSWNGTAFERMGDAVKLMAAFCYVVPGMPMIYTGQLVGNHHRLEFFEKDLIDHDENYALGALYQRMNQLRQDNPALQSNELGAPMKRLPVDNDYIFAMVRPSKKNTVLVVMNMSAEPQTVTIDLTGYEGKYECLCGHKHKLSNHETLTLRPWQYKILRK